MTNNITKYDISVVIPTYNRAEDLRETLEAMCEVDYVEREGLKHPEIWH